MFLVLSRSAAFRVSNAIGVRVKSWQLKGKSLMIKFLVFCIFQIVSDMIPEVQEEFYIVLEDPEGDVVLAEPYVATVTITANDDPNGVLSLQTLNGELAPTVYVNEDLERVSEGFVVVRNGGRFGVVGVRWLLIRNDSDSDTPLTDVSPVSGMAVFANDQRLSTILLTIFDDVEQESAERFYLQLLPGKATENMFYVSLVRFTIT